MNGRVIVWPLAGAVSLAAHGALFVGLMLVLRPDLIPSQPMPEARIEIAAHPVDRSDAIARSAKGDRLSQATAQGAGLAETAIPMSHANAVRPDTPKVADLAVNTSAAVGLPARGEVTPAAFSRPDKVAATPVLPSMVAAVSAPTTLMAALPVTSPNSAALLPVADPAVQTTALAQSLRPTETAVTASPGGTNLTQLTPDAQQVALATADAPALPDTPAQDIAAQAGPLSPPAEFATAALAWSGEENRAVDPLSLAAIQAFMQPGDLAASSASAGNLRDGLAATLNGIPCARLQTIFQPETGTLELRGHVPDDKLRAPVMAALQAQIGPAIPIADQLLVLPRPQCQALTGIANVGLAQSTEQATNPRVVGTDAYVRDYHFAAGQRLVLDLQAPDYDSVIYVDYFDADGNVLHIQPNDIVALENVAPKSLLAVGQEKDGKPSINLTVAPPYGQEIAVAFAASHPLYDGLRPLTEPAGPYLEFLRDRVALLRAERPGFKGEWVYFFITTAAE